MADPAAMVEGFAIPNFTSAIETALPALELQPATSAEANL
jgi:hypothetical protein